MYGLSAEIIKFQEKKCLLFATDEKAQISIEYTLRVASKNDLDDVNESTTILNYSSIHSAIINFALIYKFWYIGVLHYKMS